MANARPVDAEPDADAPFEPLRAGTDAAFESPLEARYVAFDFKWPSGGAALCLELEAYE